MKYSVDADMIKHARIVKGFSQVELADKVGLTVLSISNIERKQTHCPRPKAVKRICDVLEIAVSDVYRTSGESE